MKKGDTHEGAGGGETRKSSGMHLPKRRSNRAGKQAGGKPCTPAASHSSNPIRLSKREERLTPCLLHCLNMNSPRMLPLCIFCATPVPIRVASPLCFIFRQVGDQHDARFSLLYRVETWYQYHTVFKKLEKVMFF